MAIKAIKEDFVAYMMLNEKQFIVSINQNLCKFFAREEHDDMKVFYGKPIEQQFIYGFDEDRYQIAFPIQQSNPSPEYLFAFGQIYHPFKIPYIIKGNNSTDDADKLDTFDAIAFTEKVIDCLYPPGFTAVDLAGWPDSKSISFRPSEEYTYNYPIELFGEKSKVVCSVNFSGSDLINGSLGKLSAIIRVEFERSQSISEFERYYVLIKNFVAFCVGQHNIRFDSVEFKRRLTEGDHAGKFQTLGICKVFDEYEDYIEPKYHDVISIRAFDNHIINAINLLADKKANPLLQFLSNSNTGKRRVTYEDIKNLCTALEFEYSKSKFKNKGKNIQGLKKAIRRAIDEYCEASGTSDELKTQALNAFKWLNRSTAEKISILRDKIKGIIPSDDAEAFEISDQGIREFVKMRNDITHGNLIASWGNTGESYSKLCRIAYLCILLRMGLPEEKINSIFVHSIRRMF